MIGLLISQLLYIASRFFSGDEDGLVSQTEIELAQSRTKTQVAKKKADTARRSLWHKKGAFKLVFIALAFGALYDIGFAGIMLGIAILALQVVIFNPIIAIKYLKKDFFYISPNGWEGNFSKYPKIYYFTCLFLYLGMITFLILIECININLGSAA